MRGVVFSVSLLACAAAGAVEAQDSSARLPPAGYGSLTQNDLSLRLRTEDIEMRFVPLDARVTVLLGRDSWNSLRTLVESRRPSIDSVARASGISRPGLALVTFFAQRANARFDPQTLTLVTRNRVFKPLGIVPFSSRFSAQQLNVREQVSAIYLFEEDLPVNDSFSVSYAGLTSEDWERRQPTLDRERARVASRSRASARDTTRVPSADSTRSDSTP
jgi:hypothetical protein